MPFLTVLLLAEALLSADSPDPEWILGGEGESCDAACSRQDGMRCTEEVWPAGRRFVEGRAGACRTAVPGGHLEAPVLLLPSAACAWQAPERLWHAGANALSAQRCGRVPHARHRRWCPCLPEVLGGLALWGPTTNDNDDNGTLVGKIASTRAGVSGVLATSTVFTDAYRPVHDGTWFAVPLVAQAAPMALQSRVVRLVANDLTTAAVTRGEGGGVAVWRSGSAEDLPYRDNPAAQGKPKGEHAWLRSGPKWFEAMMYGRDFGDTGVPDVQGNDVRDVAATRAAFAALLSNGSVVAWGDEGSGGALDRPVSHAVQLFSTRAAFAALLEDGTVVAWGDRLLGGDLTRDVANVSTIVATEGAFAALTTQGTVTAWGDPDFGGRLPPRYHVRPHGMCSPPVNSSAACRLAADYLNASFAETRHPTLQQGCWANASSSSSSFLWNAGAGTDPCTWESVPTDVFGPPMALHWVPSEAACRAACCLLEPCGAASFAANSTVDAGVVHNCVLRSVGGFTEPLDVPLESGVPSGVPDDAGAPADNDGRPLLLDRATTFIKRYDFRAVCSAPEGDPLATVESEGLATGIFATASSFLVTLESGYAAIWPTADTVAYRADAVFPTHDAFLLVDQGQTRISTVWAVGSSSKFWTDTVAPPAPISAGSPHQHLVDVKTTRGAATALWSDGATDTWVTKPDPLSQFYYAKYYACEWNTSGEPKYVVFGYSDITREECAAICLRTPSCTGFEYPGTVYCSLWLRGSCTTPKDRAMDLYLSDLVTYELFFLTSFAFVPEEVKDEFMLVGIGQCGTLVAALPDSATGGLTEAECRTQCLASNCSAFSYAEEQKICKVYLSGVWSAFPGKQIFGTEICYRRRAYMLNGEGRIHKFLVKGENGTEYSLSHWEEPEGTFHINMDSVLTTAREFAFVTGLADPRSDFMWFSLVAENVTHRTIFLKNHVSQKVPTARMARSPWMRLDKKKIPLESQYVFKALTPRDDIWYHKEANLACHIELSPWQENVDYVVFPSVSSPSECADLCSTIQAPSPCVVFAFPYLGATVEDACVLYLGYTCTSEGSADEPRGYSRQQGSTLYTLASYSLLKTQDPQDYGENAPEEARRDVKSLHATKTGFVVKKQDSHLVSWGATGNASVLLLGEAEYLTSGVHSVVPGLQSVTVLRVGSDGHSECNPSPCYTASGVETVVLPPEVGHDDNRERCLDLHNGSWSAGDFVCACTATPHVAMGHEALCVPMEPVASWPLFLLLIPLIGGILWSLCTKRYKQKEINRHIYGLCEMYLLHASVEEQLALDAMLSVNDGNELVLLNALVPHYVKRGVEVHTFLLWQRRLASNDPRSLPVDLLKHVQSFSFGPEVLRRPRAPLMTPIGFVAAKLAKLQHESVQRLQHMVEHDGQCHDAGDIWASDLITPLVCDDDKNWLDRNIKL